MWELLGDRIEGGRELIVISALHTGHYINHPSTLPSVSERVYQKNEGSYKSFPLD